MNAQVNNKTEGLPSVVGIRKMLNMSTIRNFGNADICPFPLSYFSKAVNDVLPSATLNLEHPISKGYYCVIHNGKDIDEETIGKIKKRMREIIDADLPFHLKRFARSMPQSCSVKGA